MERSGSASLTGQRNRSRAPESAMRNLVSNCASSRAFRLQVRTSVRPPGCFNEDVGAHQSHVAQAAQGHGHVKLLPNEIEALRYPGFPSSPETIQEGTPNEDALGTKRQ